MSNDDSYPEAWTPPWITRDEPTTISDRPIESLRSGLQNYGNRDDDDDGTAYPESWRQRR